MGLLKKVTKPLSKFLDKIVPNEIKPALPYLSAFAPFMLGPGAAGGNWWQKALYNPALRAGIMGGTNIASQLAQEGSEGEFEGLSALLAAGQGYLTAGGAGAQLGDSKIVGRAADGSPITAGEYAKLSEGANLGSKSISSVQDLGIAGPMRSGEILTQTMPIEGPLSLSQVAPGATSDLTFLDKARNVGITGAEGASKFLTESGETIRDPSAWGLNKETLGAFATPVTQGTADLAMADARRALKDYENEMANTDDPLGVTDDGRRVAIRAAMEAAGHIEDDILDALASLGLRSGGIVGLKHGGRVKYYRGGDYYGNFGRDRYLSELTEEGESIMNKGQSFMDQYQAMIESGKLSHAELNDMLEQYNLLQKADEDFTSRYDNTAIEDNVEKQLDKDSFKYYDTKIKDLEKREDDIMKQEEGILALEKEMEFDASDITRSPEFQTWLNLYETDRGKALDHPKAEIFLGVLGLKLKGRDESYFDVVEKVNKKHGGRISKEGGGVASVLPKGTEMDYRGGGVIPMGSKERADDVPARLSKNEFVMTADAVRAAGGGSVNKGAKRMYNLMHKLEARV